MENKFNLNNCSEFEELDCGCEDLGIDFEEEIDFIHYQTGLDRDIVISVLLSDMDYLRFKGILPEECDCE